MIFLFLILINILIILIVILFNLLHKHFVIGQNYHTRGGISYKNKHCIFGSRGNVVNVNDVKYFRDLPCGTDIFRAYWIIFNYHLGDKDDDFIGAILLKWVKDGNIKIDKNKNDTLIHFLSKPVNCNEIEEKFYYYILQASFGNNKDGFSVDKVLDSREFKLWYKENHAKISSWFAQILDQEVDKLIDDNKIIIEKKFKNDVNYEVYYNVDDSMYDEAVKLAGLKKFLNDFTISDERKSIEVKLFDYYLIYAILLGEANKVFKEFEEIYPNDFDFKEFCDINNEVIGFIDFIFN
ncbi:MAG: hypothetical protein VZS44_05455 [Bacilli bacterium]|nr:hypothetical protein [Bacilli bacterium]